MLWNVGIEGTATALTGATTFTSLGDNGANISFLVGFLVTVTAGDVFFTEVVVAVLVTSYTTPFGAISKVLRR